MTEFTVNDDGLLSEKVRMNSVSGAEIDALTHETHMMMHRAYISITATVRRNNPTTQSLGRYNVLRLLNYAPDNRLLMSEIGDGLETSPTVVTRLIDSLVADGHVRRVEHPTDKRKVWGELTEAGSALFRQEEPAMMRQVEKVWSGLADEEKKLLNHLLSKLRLSLLTLKPEELPPLDSQDELKEVAKPS